MPEQAEKARRGTERARREVDLPFADMRRFQRELAHLLQLADLGFGGAALAARLGLLQFARDRGHQARDIAFHDIVLGAGAHRRDGFFFADAAGKDDEGQVEIVLAQHAERVERGHAWHRMVGHDQVPLLLMKRGRHAVQRLDPAHGHVVAGAAQFEPQQLRVVGRVLDDKKA